MSVESILAPLFVLVALTFFLLFYMGAVRFGALRRREVRIGDIALGQSNWPAYAAQGGNAYNNQFQLPVLFYVLVILAYIFKKADLLFVIMSWVFVVSRILHAYVHATSNNMRMRFTIFVVGAVVLMIMWIIFAVRMLLAIG
jgi:hypothetical protein